MIKKTIILNTKRAAFYVLKKEEMEPTKKQKLGIDTFDNPLSKRPAGLARTKKIIRTEISKEQLFSDLCKKIRLEDFTQNRAELQKQKRKAKRQR